MLITTKQAAEILGFKATGSVVQLVKKGKLKDYSLNKDSRHEVKLDMTEVKQFSKEFKPRYYRTHAMRVNGIGTDNTPRLPLTKPETPKETIGAIPTLGIVQRLERIETLLQTLVKELM